MKSNPALITLVVVAGVCLLLAILMFALIGYGMFDTFDFATETMTGPSPLLALIPLAIGVIAGVGALVVWGQQKQS